MEQGVVVMSKYIHIYDGEFSSSSRENGDILSLACIVIKADTLEFVDSFVGYGKPRDLNEWNYHAEKVHGISKTKASTFPTQRELAISLLHFLKPYKNEDNSPMPMVIHASSYVDYEFITRMYQKVGIVGSIEKVMTKKMVIRTDIIFKQYLNAMGSRLNKTNLKVMAGHFDIELDHHECMSDTKACYEGFKQMVNFFKDKNPLYSPTVDYSAFNHAVELYSA